MSDVEAKLVEALREAWPYVPDHHGPVQHRIKAALAAALENREDTSEKQRGEGELPPLPEPDTLQSVSLEAMRYVTSWPKSYLEEYAEAYARAALAQQARPQPLPDHEIVTMYDEGPTCDADMIRFARAIERAHGIGGPNE